VTDIENRWAWSRVEAMADRTLSPVDQRRMRGAMAIDPQLQRAVESAIALRRELRRLGRVPTPSTLRRRLLGITNDGRNPAPWIRFSATWAVGCAAAAVAVVAFVLLRTAPETRPPPEAAPSAAEAQAVEDFVIAMKYLQKSATIANAEVAAAVGGSLNDALSASRDEERERKRQPKKNGG